MKNIDKLTRIQTPKEAFTVDYPVAQKFMEEQEAVFWPFYEVRVEKDKQDILVHMNEAERHGVITTLKLFTKYELIIGNEFWLEFVMKKFPRPADIQPMAALFGAMELSVHAHFYNKINQELNLDTDDFYLEYLEDPELKQRIDYLEEHIGAKDDLYALATFAFGEGAILYSSFAFLKHFQSQGKNLLSSVNDGISFSARDENLHSEAAAWLFNTLKEEKLEAGLIDEEYLKELEKGIREAANTVLEHEKLIIAKIFEHGKIEGITEQQLENFTKSRINLCLRNMGYKNEFDVSYNPIAEWFYKGINGTITHDFFSSQGHEYQRDYDRSEFKLKF